METNATVMAGKGPSSKTVHLVERSRFVRGNIVLACNGRTMNGYVVDGGVAAITCKLCLKKVA